MLCDALATALFVTRKPEEILKIYPDYGAVLVSSQAELVTMGKFSGVELSPAEQAIDHR